MRITIEVPLKIYIHSDKLQETYEALLIMKKASEDTDEESLLNKFLQQVKEKLDYLKYRQEEIDNRLREREEDRQIMEAERKRKSNLRESDNSA